MVAHMFIDITPFTWKLGLVSQVYPPADKVKGQCTLNSEV